MLVCANNFVFIHRQSHLFNLICWRNALSGDSRTPVSRILIASPSMQISTATGDIGGKRQQETCNFTSKSFPFPRAFFAWLARSFTRSLVAYRPEIRTRRDQHSDETRTRSMNNGTVIPFVKHREKLQMRPNRRRSSEASSSVLLFASFNAHDATMHRAIDTVTRVTFKDP